MLHTGTGALASQLVLHAMMSSHGLMCPTNAHGSAKQFDTGTGLKSYMTWKQTKEGTQQHTELSVCSRCRAELTHAGAQAGH